MKNNKKQIGMYIHIPFCIQKCLYCDFLSFKVDEDTRKKYVEILIKQINDAYVPDPEEYILKSVYFGGGTPSVLEACDLRRILDVLLLKYSNLYASKESMEITIECNPGTVDYEKFVSLRKAGFNRLSLGLQSANDVELKALGRIHDYIGFENAYKSAVKAGFDNINVDIMTAILYQKMDSLKDTLDKVIALKPAHISAYSLIIEENTKLKEIIDNTEDILSVLPNEDTERDMTYFVNDTLKRAGYSHYEISNYARKGFESVHNKSYWECKEYFGFGLGSSSYFNKKRWKNTSNLKDFLDGDFKEYEVDRLSKEDMMSEYMFLGLRKTEEGISIKEFEDTFKENIFEIFGKVIKKYTETGFIKILNDERIVLTEKGIDVSNVIMADFILEL